MYLRDNSSVGRASASKAEGRGFESRLSLIVLQLRVTGYELQVNRSVCIVFYFSFTDFSNPLIILIISEVLLVNVS